MDLLIGTTDGLFRATSGTALPAAALKGRRVEHLGRVADTSFASDDEGRTWRSLGDTAHSPSPTNFFGIIPDPETVGGVLVGTDLGEVWRVSPGGAWTQLAAGLPDVQAVLPLP